MRTIIWNSRAATLLIAGTLAMGISSLPAKADCSKLEVLACAAAYSGGAGVLSAYCAKCLFISLDTSGTGTEPETLTDKPKPLRAAPYGDPKKGFGDYTPVTLPPDRGHPAPGTNTGIPISNGPHREIPPPQYFRPR
jgi:hypothetical protein